MGVDSPLAPKANGLSTVVNVIAAPREAFETLRIAPTWGWAFVIATVLSAIGTYLAAPATIHAFEAEFHQQAAVNPQMAQMSPAQVAHLMAFTENIMRLGWLFAPVTVIFSVLIQAVVMLIFKALGRGDADFTRLWASAMNVAVVTGLYYVVNGVVLQLRGPQSFVSPVDTLRAIPSLSWLVPHAGPKAIAFLSAINPFTLWVAILLGLAMVVVARVPRLHAALVALISLLIPALRVTAGAK